MYVELPAFHRGRVLVVGDLMLDRYWHGSTRRISPEAPVPVVHIQDSEDRPGGAGNVALNIAALGGQVTLLALVGEDEAADTLRDRLEKAGVLCLLENVPGASTVTKLRVLSRHQQLIRLDFEDGFSTFDALRLQERFTACLQQVKVVVFSDYGKGSLRVIEPMIAAARARGKRVLIDPKGADFRRYQGATLITPNEMELEAVVGPWGNDQELIGKATALREDCRLEAILVTRGEQGMILISAHGEAHQIPAQAREVYDVTGAGDTVIATLAAGLAADEDLLEATILANLAAGIVVGKLGAATISVAELRQAMQGPVAPLTGIINLDDLLKQLENVRLHGERIVMTNGCFDLLHAGHVQYLEQARRLGDRLIVAVNDDASVHRLKGPERPINPLPQRMLVLAALSSVDWVIPFAEDTPKELICRLQPDVLVKGGDYRPEDIAGADCVWERGGEVVVLDYLEGCSTSGTLARILNAEARTNRGRI